MSRRMVVGLLGCVVGFLAGPSWAQETASPTALQAEVARLRQRVAEIMEKLEAQRQQAPKPQKAAPEPLTFHGYIQMRYERDSTQPSDANNLQTGRARTNFRLRRVRFDARARPFPEGLFRLQVDAAERDVLLRDAYLEVRLGQGTLTFGHFKVPFLEEVLESSSVRWTPERARVSTQLFPGERDRGIAYTFQVERGPQVTLGLFSGTRSAETQDSLTSRKSWLVRLVQPLEVKGRGTLGRAWLGRMDGIGRRDFGALGAPDVRNFDRERTVLGLLLSPAKGPTFRAEWVDGKDSGTAAAPTAKVRGWYGLLGYRLPEQPFTLYAKYDQYDPDRAAAGNTFRRSALGLQFDWNSFTRLNLTWESQRNPKGTIWTFQTQMRY